LKHSREYTISAFLLFHIKIAEAEGLTRTPNTPRIWGKTDFQSVPSSSRIASR